MSVQATSSTLRAAFERVRAPLPDGADDYAIVTSVGVGYLARGRSGAPTFLVPLTAVPGGVGRRGGGFALSPTSCVAFDYGGRRWEQAAATLECTELELMDTFLVLAIDLARRVESKRNEINWSDLLTWVDEWQTLLSGQGGMSNEQQLGLWGELWLVAQARDPDALMAAWRGPDRDAVDFFFDGAGLEVKVSRAAHLHHMSQRQANLPVGQHESYFLSIWVAPEPIRGISLTELVDSLISGLADPATFLKRIAQVGYSLQNRELYDVRYLVLEQPLWFSAVDVPRIRAVDPGVSNVRYAVNLDPERAIPEEMARQLWMRFLRTELSLTTKPVAPV